MTKSISLEDIARQPRPGWSIPGAPSFSPDDTLITYLHSPEGGLVRRLYALNPETGERKVLMAPPEASTSEEHLSLEEKLRRERQRQLELGVTSYAWAAKGSRLLAPFATGLYVQDGPDAPMRLVASPQNGPVIDPRFSPDGQWIAFVQADELWVVPSNGSAAPRQVTFGAAERGLTHGLAEYIAQEEMSRSQGFWWSPDSRRLAFEEVDETHIPIYRITHQGSDQTGEGAQEDHRYPFAGKDNARVRLGVVSIDGGEPVWMDLGADPDIYLARVNWLPDGSLTAQVENREQTRLDLLRFDSSGQPGLLLSETNEVWINLHNAFRALKTGPFAGGFIWASERTGFRHLYLYNGQAELLHPLTTGDWMVDDVIGIDEDNSILYFTATMHSPLESHLYAVSLDGSAEPRRITAEPGVHQVILDHACRRFIDIHNALLDAPNVTLRSTADGSLITTIYENSDPRVAELALEPPQFVSLPSRDGVTLYGALYRPPAQFGPGPYPTIVNVYGGPHAQMVTHSWRMTTDMRAQYLRQQGFLVFVLDNRGSARRGLKFEGAIKHNLGDLEVRDQVDGVRWLVQERLADPQRVGVYGWSYGGYMALMCLTRAPEVFRCAVSGAPVTAWDGYDTFYTERYMGTPHTNSLGYESSAVMTHVHNIQGALLLIHGLIDENVHFRHTARLINALIQARKTYSLLLFPDERHMPRKQADRVFMEEQIRDFFVKELGQ